MIDLNGAYPSLANWAELSRRFFTSRYVLHLENEVEHLRGQNARLTVQLEMAGKPQAPVPQVMRTPPVPPKPVKTSWEVYLAEEIKKQELEEVI